MSDLMNGIKMLLSNAWKFFQIDVPGTSFSFGVLAVGLCLVPISLTFLSLVVGFPVGTVDGLSATFGAKGSRRYKVSSARKNDTR